MKRKLLPLLLCLALLAAFCPLPAAAATDVAPLAVFLQQGNAGTPVPLHTFSRTEMQALPCVTQYYTGIDSMPAVVQGKANGVLLTTLIQELQQYNPSVSFGPADAIKLAAIDNYATTYTYNYLYGGTRYCYPAFIDVQNANLANPAAAPPMLAIVSAQDRYLTRTELDSQTMDATESFRFCFGLLPADAVNTTVTANKFIKWVNKMIIILDANPPPTTVPACTLNANAGTGGTITPSGSLTVTQHASQTFSIRADSGYKIAAVTVDGAAKGTVSDYTFTDVTSAHNISVTFRPVWDLNSDHKCDIGDITMIGNKWGATGPAEWIPEDVNQDGVINMGDVVMVGYYWGKTW